MSSIAENINNIIRESTCEVIIHPGVSCGRNVIDLFLPMLWNNAKFFLPIIFIPYLLKFRQFNNEMAKEALKSYMGATLSGLSFGFTISASLCTLKRLLSNKENGLFVKVAALIGGHWIHMCPKKVVHLFCIAVFQTSLETVIRSKRNLLTRALFNSRYFLQTLFFMTSSCIILQSLQIVNHKVFWFTYPVNKPKAEICSTHKGKCVKHCLQLMLKNLLIGGALDIFKHLSSMRKNSTINFSMASFLVAYSGIYRILICVLNKYFYEKFDELHAVAAFLSGIAYVFAPRTTLLSYGIVISIELLWMVINAKFRDNKDLKKYLEVPYHKIMLPFALSFLVHSYVFNRSAVSSFGAKFINGVTNNKALEIYRRLLFLNALPA